MSSFDQSIIKEKHKLISWPTPQDYQEAVQSPSDSLADETLQGGETEVNSLGLPRPRTGNFACVYKIKCPSKEFAVRFFLHNITDQDERYRELSNALNGNDLPYTVDFEYKPEGIRIYGNWYPALKMLWVEGEPLDQYINRHHYSQEKMFELLEQFTTMMKALQVIGIAHGDLQHGNILVTTDGLRLVDYDGMFVPALNGHGSNELGHRNYQHPGRTGEHFGPYLDNFSAWAIYSALETITIDPSTWKILKGGDECLLFRGTDFQDPGRSRAFGLLAEHPCNAIRERCAQLQSFLAMTPDQVPPLTYEEQTRTVIDEERKKHYHEEQWYEQASEWFDKDSPLSADLPAMEQESTFTIAKSPLLPTKRTMQVAAYRATLILIGIWLALHHLNSVKSVERTSNHLTPLPCKMPMLGEQLSSLPISFSMDLDTLGRQAWVRPAELPIYLTSSKDGNSVVVVARTREGKQLQALQYFYNGKHKGLALDYPPGRTNLKDKLSGFANVHGQLGTSHAIKWKRSESTLESIDIQKLILDDFGSTLTEASNDFKPSKLDALIPPVVPTLSQELERLGQKAWDEAHSKESLFCYYMIYKVEAAAKVPQSKNVLIGCLTKMRGRARQLRNSTLLAVLGCRSIPFYEFQNIPLTVDADNFADVAAELETELKHLTDIYLESYSIDQSKTVFAPMKSRLSLLARYSYSSTKLNGLTQFEASWQYIAETATRMLRGDQNERRAGEALIGTLKDSFSQAPTESKHFCLNTLHRLERGEKSGTVGKLLRFLKSH